MSKFDDLDVHHIPRKKDKKKHHRKGFNEDSIMENRATRLSFKNYMRQLDEQMLEDNWDEDESLDNEE